MAREKISGIYCIENLVNGKKYIGQSVDISTRWRCHKSELNKNNHYNIHLQRAWNKYGIEKFHFYIIEKCNYKDLDIKEKYYIELYGTFKNGYNRETGGKAYKILSNESRKLMSASWKNINEDRRNNMRYAQKSTPIYQIDFNGNIINNWYSVREASKKSKIGFRGIWNCLKKERRTFKQFIWIYQDEYKDFCLNDYLNCNTQAKVVYQFDLEGNLIKRWESANSATTNGYDASAILKCCKDKYITHKNFIWRYVAEVDKEVLSYIKNKSEIKMYDLNMNYIRSFSSLVEIHKETGISMSCISLCLNKKIKKTHGFILTYAY